MLDERSAAMLDFERACGTTTNRVTRSSARASSVLRTNIMLN